MIIDGRLLVIDGSCDLYREHWITHLLTSNIIEILIIPNDYDSEYDCGRLKKIEVHKIISKLCFLTRQNLITPEFIIFACKLFHSSFLNVYTLCTFSKYSPNPYKHFQTLLLKS